MCIHNIFEHNIIVVLAYRAGRVCEMGVVGPKILWRASAPNNKNLPSQNPGSAPAYLDHPLVTAEATGDATLAQSEHNGNARAVKLPPTELAR